MLFLLRFSSGEYSYIGAYLLCVSLYIIGHSFLFSLCPRLVPYRVIQYIFLSYIQYFLYRRNTLSFLYNDISYIQTPFFFYILPQYFLFLYRSFLYMFLFFVLPRLSLYSNLISYPIGIFLIQRVNTSFFFILPRNMYFPFSLQVSQTGSFLYIYRK